MSYKRMYEQNVTFACGHKNVFYTGREGSPSSVQSGSPCPACAPEPPRRRRYTIHEGVGKVTIVPMLAEHNRPAYMVFVKEISTGGWILSYHANHPLHAFLMITCVYPGLPYLEPHKVINRTEV